MFRIRWPWTSDRHRLNRLAWKVDDNELRHREGRHHLRCTVDLIAREIVAIQKRIDDLERSADRAIEHPLG